MRWLHLSDLHFGDDRQHHGLDRSRVLSALLDDVKQQLATAEPLDAVFVTGDVAWTGAESNYEEAQAWFGLLLQAATVKNKIPELYWVPGNHDLDRTQVTKNELSEAVHEQARQTHGKLEGLWRNDNSRAYLTKKFDCYQAAFGAFDGQPFWERTLTTDLGPVRILGLNSALLSYNDQDKGQLRLGHQQLLALRSPALTIVLQHHPPSWLADGEDELNDLASQPHLMLSGHEHDGQGFLIHRIGRGEIFLVQAPAGHARDVQVFGYLLGELTTEGLKIWARIWADGRFVNDTARFGDQVPARSKLSETINKVLHPPPTDAEFSGYATQQIGALLKTSSARPILARILLKNEAASPEEVTRHLTQTSSLSEAMVDLALIHEEALRQSVAMAHDVMAILGWLAPAQYCLQEALHLKQEGLVVECPAPSLAMVELMVARLDQRAMAARLSQQGQVLGCSALVQVWGSSFSRPAEVVEQIRTIYYPEWQRLYGHKGALKDNIDLFNRKHRRALELKIHRVGAVPPFYLVMYGSPQEEVVRLVQQEFEGLRVVFVPPLADSLDKLANEIEVAFKEILERTKS